MDDLYSDLIEDVTISDKTELESQVLSLQLQIRELQEVVKSREQDAEDVRKHLDSVERENTVLRANISSLYRTARAEIDRKNQLVQESRKVPCQRSENKKRVGNLSNAKRNDRYPNDLSNETNSPAVQRNDEIIVANDQDGLSKETNSSLGPRNDETIVEIIQDELPKETNSSRGQRSDETIHQDGFSNDTTCPLEQRNDETIVENYQDELSRTRKTLKRLIDEILRNNDLRISCSSVDLRGKSREGNSPFVLRKSCSVERNVNMDNDEGLSEISSDSSSNYELRMHSRRLRKSKKKKKKKKKRKISSSATWTPRKKRRGESPS